MPCQGATEVMGAMDIVEVEAGPMICAMVAPMGVMENVPMGVKGLRGLATFNFKNFDISPGDGGKYFIYSTGQEFIWRSQNIFMILLLYNSMNQFFVFGGDCKSATKITMQ